MNLYFEGRTYPITICERAKYLVRINGPRPDSLGSALIGLSRNDLRGIAQRKYGPGICQASGVQDRFALWRFLEMAGAGRYFGRPAPLPIPSEWDDLIARATRLRRIPHVRMVRAAALQPGMRVPLIREDGRYVGETVVIGVAPCGWGVNVTTKWLPYRPGMTRQQQQDQYANMPPRCLQYAADHVFPVMIEWRDKVAL